MSSPHTPPLNQLPADLKEALDKFHGEAEHIVKSFVATLEALPPPPIVFHYTSDVGLRGILESGRVWLTDIFNLNDPSELRHGLSRVVSILKARAANGPPESKAFAEYFAGFEQRGGLQKSAQYFICSFSACGDDLGQWRAYADNGRGYALAFDAKVLEDAFGTHGAARIARPFPIRYKDSDLIEIHRKLVNSMFDLTFLLRGKNLKKPAEMAYIAQLATWLMVHALGAGLHFKHEAYSNEQEYRFLEAYPAHQPPQTKSRVRRYSLIKYTEFDWKSVTAGALKRIVVGPAADPQRACQFANEGSAECGLNTVALAC